MNAVNKPPTKRQIETTLFSMGFRPEHKGTKYMSEAVAFLLEDPDAIFGITKDLYPMVARKNNCSSSSVEHAIRCAVNHAWSVSGSGGISHYFSSYSTKPANRTVMAFLAKYCKGELMIDTESMLAGT